MKTEKIKLNTFKMIMKQAIKDGKFIFEGKSFVILNAEIYDILNNKALSYDRIKEFVNKGK